ncbi:MAG: BtpA/SgcQ family protein, partial [Desulfobacterales bacterium]
PFFPGSVPASVTAQMTALAAEIRRRFDRPLGVNVLRNDGVAALACEPFYANVPQCSRCHLVFPSSGGPGD